MITRGLHLGTFIIGALVTILGAVLFTEGLGWWELERSHLPYLIPAVLIVAGLAVIANELGRPTPRSDHRP